jgi:hypothetical protein
MTDYNLPVDLTREFIKANQDDLHYSTVEAIAADLNYDLSVLLSGVTN